ncbi:MAG: response regulator [Holophaga sp.]|nr:response regulator [Holophaga sp.]
MPRLLLVDDNSSIHKIAESLLMPTDIDLVCVESAKDALNLVAQGERFDVALLDTAMPGMDGWTLLKQLRMHPATASIPIAMMAGVLDTIDPSQIDHPAIQGFLKKPVELRDLGQRIHALLLMQVAAVEPAAQDFSPFSTMPAVKLSELGKPHPEERPEALDLDVLVLEESDLWPEPPAVIGTRTEDLSPFSEIPPEVQLDIEDFDLDSLRTLTSGAATPAPELPVLQPEVIPTGPSFDLLEPEPAAPTEDDQPINQELPDLGPESEPTFDPSSFDGFDALEDDNSIASAAPASEIIDVDPDFLSDLGEVSNGSDLIVVDWSQPASTTPLPAPADPMIEGPGIADEVEVKVEVGDEILFESPLDSPSQEITKNLEDPFDIDADEGITNPGLVEAFVAPAIPEPEPVTPSVPETAPEPPVAPLVPAVASTPASNLVPTSVPSPETEAILQAILANPALMDLLTKAVVAKLGDQALKEIAWEVMPELAERLNRH